MFKKEISCGCCGSICTLKQEHREFTVRGNDVFVDYWYYECSICHERFTTNEMDEENIKMVWKTAGFKYPECLKDENK